MTFSTIDRPLYNPPFQTTQRPYALYVQETGRYPATGQVARPFPRFAPANTQAPNGAAVNPLTTKLAVQQGLKNGLLFGAMAALPIYLLERWKNSPTFVQQNIEFLERFFKGVHKELSWANFFRHNPGAVLVSSIGGTLLVGGTAGMALGVWMTNRTRNRLNEIEQVRKEQQAGIYTPKAFNILQKLGLAEKPVTNPSQSYQKMMNEDLDENNAFKKWASLILLLKVAPIGIVMLGSMALLAVMPVKEASFLNQQIRISLKSSLHPVVIAKLAALPLMGGFIAKSIVPWIKTQINQN